jgi:hypothetical protein
MIGFSMYYKSSWLNEVGGSRRRDLRFEVRRIRYGASRDRGGDVVWLDFMAPHRHLVVDVTVSSVRTKSNVHAVGAPLPLPGSLVTGVQYGKVDADIYTLTLLVTPSIQ